MACLGGAQEEPAREVSPMPVSPPDTAGLSSAPVVEKKVGPTLNGAPGGAASIEGVDKIYIYIFPHSFLFQARMR